MLCPLQNKSGGGTQQLARQNSGCIAKLPSRSDDHEIIAPLGCAHLDLGITYRTIKM